MTVRERERSGTLTDFSVAFQLMLSYRLPMKVKDAIILPRYPHNHIYYRCPRCQHILERDFVAYCCNCGQCIDWQGYWKAKQTRFKPKKEPQSISRQPEQLGWRCAILLC